MPWPRPRVSGLIGSPQGPGVVIVGPEASQPIITDLPAALSRARGAGEGRRQRQRREQARAGRPRRDRGGFPRGAAPVEAATIEAEPGHQPLADGEDESPADEPEPGIEEPKDKTACERLRADQPEHEHHTASDRRRSARWQSQGTPSPCAAAGAHSPVAGQRTSRRPARPPPPGPTC